MSVRVTNVIDLTEWVANYVMLSFQLMLDDADCGLTIMNWKELSEKGLVFRINHEILHPPGLAVGYEMTNGVSAGASWLNQSRFRRGSTARRPGLVGGDDADTNANRPLARVVAIVTIVYTNSILPPCYRTFLGST